MSSARRYREAGGPATDQGSGARGRACVALPAHGVDYDEIGAVLAQVIQELGWDVTVVRDGDVASLHADALIMFGKCSAFPHLAKILSERPARRPATVLWHIEPLPPGIVPPQAECLSRLLARCDWNQLPSTLSVPAKCIPGHNLVRDMARSVLSARLSRRAGWARTR